MPTKSSKTIKNPQLTIAAENIVKRLLSNVDPAPDFDRLPRQPYTYDPAPGYPVARFPFPRRPIPYDPAPGYGGGYVDPAPQYGGGRIPLPEYDRIPPEFDPIADPAPSFVDLLDKSKIAELRVKQLARTIDNMEAELDLLRESSKLIKSQYNIK